LGADNCCENWEKRTHPGCLVPPQAQNDASLSMVCAVVNGMYVCCQRYVSAASDTEKHATESTIHTVDLCMRFGQTRMHWNFSAWACTVLFMCTVVHIELPAGPASCPVINAVGLRHEQVRGRETSCTNVSVLCLSTFSRRLVLPISCPSMPLVLCLQQLPKPSPHVSSPVSPPFLPIQHAIASRPQVVSLHCAVQAWRESVAIP